MPFGIGRGAGLIHSLPVDKCDPAVDKSAGRPAAAQRSPNTVKTGRLPGSLASLLAVASPLLALNLLI